MVETNEAISKKIIQMRELQINLQKEIIKSLRVAPDRLEASISQLAATNAELTRFSAARYNKIHYQMLRFINDLVDDVQSISIDAKVDAKKKLIVSVLLWGESYTNIFVKYFIPSLLSPNNLPAVARKREIILDLFIASADWQLVKNSPSFRELEKILTVNMIEVPEDLTKNELHPHPGFRYEIYGNVHQVSMRRAKKLNADIICLAPDGVHADGSYANMVKFIDEGYEAVAFTTVRGQAETIFPSLDQLRDDATNVLTILPQELMRIAANNIHHTFNAFIPLETNEHFETSSVVLYPDPQGMILRVFHIHPIIMSSDCVQKECPIDGQTVDAGFMSQMFSEPESWENIKIVTDSDEIAILDLTHIISGYVHTPGKFSKEKTAARAGDFDPIHHWVFSHPIHFNAGEKISGIRSFDLEEGKLVPHFFPIEELPSVSHEELANFVNEFQGWRNVDKLAQFK